MGLEWAGLQEGCSLQHSQNTPGNTPGLPGESSEHSLPCPVLILPLEEGGVVVVARPHLTSETPSGKVGREEEAPKQLLLILCWMLGKLGASGYFVSRALSCHLSKGRSSGLRVDASYASACAPPSEPFLPAVCVGAADTCEQGKPNLTGLRPWETKSQASLL